MTQFLYQVSNKKWIIIVRYQVLLAFKFHKLVEKYNKLYSSTALDRLDLARHVASPATQEIHKRNNIQNIWRNEKYFLVQLIYQLFGYNLGKIQQKNIAISFSSCISSSCIAIQRSAIFNNQIYSIFRGRIFGIEIYFFYILIDMNGNV